MDTTATKPGSPGRLNSLHDLVLDYINHHAFAATAKVLAQPRPRRTPTPGEPSDAGAAAREEGVGEAMDVEGNTEANGKEELLGGVQKDRNRERLFTDSELESIEQRRVVLNLILNGAIMRAVEVLNAHFPAVLDETIPVPTRTNGSNHTVLGGQPGPPEASIVSLTAPSTSASGSKHSVPVLSHSTVPAHVKLNLQIQSFIESFRNLAPSSPSSPASSISSLTSSMHVSTHNLTAVAPSTTSNGTGGSSVSPGVTLTNALTAAQGLHAEAKKLPPDVRAVYLQEIKDVGALFAYTDPETSILSGFLAQERRVALAEQVNFAILATEERSGPAFLHSIAQRTRALYAIMSAKGIDPRPAGYDERGGKKDHLSRYWKNQTGDKYQFDLHEFTDLPWQ
ncbi:hypothetical protein DB88DRAFT_489683 [Papiliotrema laurentii]|uniref:CRA domain-containing protein n=1 Tax=Papiliotrema laurentii TaxID=5418 RepID=A0AAD9FPU5_PAPLA|nr:hypothetical protein DB88DRAFT_489683 [Papiliotrema laurentii]